MFHSLFFAFLHAFHSILLVCNWSKINKSKKCMKSEASHVKHIVKSIHFFFVCLCVWKAILLWRKTAKLLTWNKSCIDMKNFALFCIHFGILINSWEWEKKIKREVLNLLFYCNFIRNSLHICLLICGENKKSLTNE